ncbi:MAG TPA: urease accessory UreF family protein [Chthoniobacterales bacterium]|jgi:hypothetical protein
MENLSAQPEEAYVASPVEECQRIVRVANPALLSMAAVTYHAGFRVLDDRFSGWLHGTFQQEILPGLLEAVRYGSDEHGRELLATDQSILRNASELLRRGSGRAGRLLLRQGVPMGVKCLQRLQLAAQEGFVEGHLATVFGARCGVFSIGQRAAALAYVYLELRTGAPDWDDRQVHEKLAEASEVIGCYFERKAVLHRENGGIFHHWRSHG